jgi:hypothetical protein
MKPIDRMPWDEVEIELLAALPNDEPSDVWRYSDLLPRASEVRVERARRLRFVRRTA